MKPMPRVLIVEDEPDIAELIALNLRHHAMETVWAPDGERAQAEINSVLPDLILLDWMLPGQSGAVLAKKWRSHPRTREVPILMITARSTDADKVAGLDAGADDYITKPFSTQELLARIRAALRRSASAGLTGPVTLGPVTLDTSTHRVTLHGTALKLGPTEFKLLSHLMLHPERVHSRGQLLDQVWGDHVFIEERTVDVHIKRLRESLGESAGLIETVRGAGYRFSVPHSTPNP